MDTCEKKISINIQDKKLQRRIYVRAFCTYGKYDGLNATQTQDV